MGRNGKAVRTYVTDSEYALLARSATAKGVSVATLFRTLLQNEANRQASRDVLFKNT